MYNHQNPQSMPKTFDKRLADYADSLNKLIEDHEELLIEYEEKRVIFNAQFKKTMQRKIRPVVHRLLDEAAEAGHWVEIHTYSTEKYLAYVHQCYTFNWKTGGRTTLCVVANYDYQKVFFVIEQGETALQQAIAMPALRPGALYSWLKSAILSM